MASIVVCTPMYNGVCSGAYTESLLQLNNLLNANGHSFHYICLTNESLIQRGRNTLAWYFLNTTEASHLMFIDADIGFRADDVIKMIEADREVIAGIYPKKGIDWESVKYAYNRDLENPQRFSGMFVYDPVPGTERIFFDQPLELMNAGTGFMLIKREVFKELEDSVGSYISNNYTQDRDSKTFNYFQVAVDGDRLLSEDYFFCRAYQKIGGKIYGAPWCNFTHIGTYGFSGSFVDSLKLRDRAFLDKEI
jgi:hypothetical protein